MQKRLVFGGLLLLFVALFGRRASASDDLQTLLSMLESRAQTVGVGRWGFDTVTLKGAAVFDLPMSDNMLKSARERGIESFKVVPQNQVKGHALFDFRKGRYQVEFEFVNPRAEGKSIAYSEKRTMSFDGEMYVDLVEPNQEAKPGTAPRVEFDRVYRDVGLRSSRLIQAGYFYTQHQLPLIAGVTSSNEFSWSLTDFVNECRKNPKVKFEPRSSELWAVCFPLRVDSKDYGMAEYRFNPKMGAALESVVRLPGLNYPPSEEFLFKNIEWGGGTFGPSEVVWIDWVNGSGRRTKLANVKLNEILDDKSFAVKVPVGATVNDQEHQMFYSVSKGPQEDAKSISKYIEVNDVALSHVKKSSSYLSGVFILTFLLVLACVLVWWRRGVAFCFAFLLVDQCGCDSKITQYGTNPTVQLAKIHSDFVWDEGWKWSFSKRDTVCVSQCGFTATTLVMKLFGRSFEPVLVSKMMPPTTLGTKLSDMKQVLEAHCVDVEARRAVKLTDLFSYLDGETIAIVHMPSLNQSTSKQAHYVVLIREKEDALLYLDPPSVPVRLTSDNKNKWDMLTDLAVLICKSGPVQPKLRPKNREVRFAPQDFSEGKLTGDIQLVNDSEKPVYIASVNVPCSCVSTDFQPQIVAEHGTVSFAFTVDGRQWGDGHQTKSITINGLENIAVAQFDLIGASVTPSLPNIGSRYASKQIDVPLNCSESFILTSAFPLFETYTLDADLLSIKVGDGWCKCKAFERDKMIFLQVDCEINTKDMQDFLSSGRLSTSVVISNKGESVPIYELSLTLQRDLEVKSIATSGDQDVVSVEISVNPTSDLEWQGWNLERIEVDTNEIEIKSLTRIGDTLWKAECVRVGLLERPFVGKCIFARLGFPELRRPITIQFGKVQQ